MPTPEPRRLRLVAIVLVAAGLLAAALPLSPTGRWVGCVSGLVIGGVLAGAAEVWADREAFVAGRRRRRERVAAISSRPLLAPDHVPQVPLRDVQSVPNRDDPRWGRFQSLDPGTGSAKSSAAAKPSVLIGRVALASLFVGRHGRTWTDAEIARGHRTLVRCCRWIEGEAHRWGAPLDVVLPDVYFQAVDTDQSPVELAFTPEGDDVGPMEAHAGFKAQALVARVAAMLGFADGVDLTEQVAARLDADVIVWLVHLAEEGRPIAITVADRDNPGLSLAVCYAHLASFPGPLDADRSARVDPITVVHEVLHLFGATDKYGVKLATFPRGSVGRNDVMRLDHGRLAQLVVGPLTAAELGWDS